MYWAGTARDRAFVGLTGAPALESSALLAAVLLTLSFWMYSFGTSLSRVRTIILEREREADWLVGGEGPGQ
jgi:heme exporter protein C